MENKKARLCLTGASGFLGQELLKELQKDFEVCTLGRQSRNDIVCDLAINQPALTGNYEVIVHNAGKAHMVPRTDEEIKAFFSVNVEGTKHLLSALDQLSNKPRSFIFISTIAVYGRDSGELIDEQHPLNGETPYAKSKIQAEQLIREWCAVNKVNYLILRLPLVVGAHPPGNLGAIIKAIQKGYYFKISNNQARKSAVLGKDVAQLIPKVLDKEGIYNLTDGEHPLFADIEQAIATGLGKKIKLSIPLSLLQIVAKFGDLFAGIGLPFPITSNRLQKMVVSLTFNDQKAQKELRWHPQPILPFLEKNLTRL